VSLHFAPVIYKQNTRFVFWEVNPRWLANFFYVFIFLACLTVKGVIDAVGKRRREKAAVTPATQTDAAASE